MNENNEQMKPASKKRIGIYARLTPTLERQLKVVMKKTGVRGPQEYVRDVIRRDFAAVTSRASSA